MSDAVVEVARKPQVIPESLRAEEEAEDEIARKAGEDANRAWYHRMADTFKEVMGSVGYWYEAFAHLFSAIWYSMIAVGQVVGLPGFKSEEAKIEERHEETVAKLNDLAVEQKSKVFNAVKEATDIRFIANRLVENRKSFDDELLFRVRPHIADWLMGLKPAELVELAKTERSQIVMAAADTGIRIPGVRTPREVAAGVAAAPATPEQRREAAQELQTRVENAILAGGGTLKRRPRHEPEIADALSNR